MARGTPRRHLLVPAGVVAALAVALAALGGFHAPGGPLLGAYFVFLLVAGVRENVVLHPGYRVAWGVGFLVAGGVLVARGHLGPMTAVLPFAGVALLSNLAYQQFAP